ELITTGGIRSCEIRALPRGAGARGARKAVPAADRQSLGRHGARAAQQSQRAIGEVLAQGSERGPLAADQAQQRGRLGLIELDAVVARHETGRSVLVPGERADAGEAVDDLVA